VAAVEEETANGVGITELVAEATLKVAVAAIMRKPAGAEGTVAAGRRLRPLKRCPPRKN
jgi:hypothetical protein